MDVNGYEIGMIGLGVMGRNLVLNMADHGYSVAGYNRSADKTAALENEGIGKKVRGARSIREFVGLLRRPRAVMMLVPAGPAVDAMIHETLPYLEKNDLIIDGGNSHFKDTNIRAATLAEKGIHFLGVGISGGEQGARHGPSMMPGGTREAYERVRPIFEAVAAKVNGEPCVTYIGPGAAGHYVKMVHNGIEYGLMQLIAEAYDLLKRGLDFDDDQLHDVFDGWNKGELQSFLIEIAARIFRQPDPVTGKRLVDIILDQAKQKGTGKWMTEDAMELQVPIPTIDIAVSMRDMSAYKAEREQAAKLLSGPASRYRDNKQAFVSQLKNALFTGMIITYAQGMALLQKASEAYGYGLNLVDIARIWRGGCIIRASLLEEICAAFKANPALPNLMMDPHLSSEIMRRQYDLRQVAQKAAELGLSAAGMMASLAYFDAYRSAWLPANLIQAQRDLFGAHTYERVDAEGVFHTEWDSE